MKNILILSLVLLFSCKQEKNQESYLGIVNIEVSGNKNAVPHFEKGLLLLHSFEYADSREAFLEAQKTDPDMLMSYWGEAMTYNHPLWSEQDFEKGTGALKKLKNIQSTAEVSELEKDFILLCSRLWCGRLGDQLWRGLLDGRLWCGPSPTRSNYGCQGFWSCRDRPCHLCRCAR